MGLLVVVLGLVWVGLEWVGLVWVDSVWVRGVGVVLELQVESLETCLPVVHENLNCTVKNSHFTVTFSRNL